MGRIDWRDVPLPAGYPERADEREAILDGKPRHWRLWYDGTLVSNYEAPADWVPATLTPDQVREVNARNAVECELIDEALGRVLARIAERGWSDDLDVFFTTDHGELQGDFGLLFKGPYHVDALMRLPLVWRPAPSARPPPSVVTRPVGLVDLAPTFCAIAGIDRRRGWRGSPAGRRRRRRRPRVRAGAHRMGQRALRRRRPPPHHHRGPLGVHRLPPGHLPRRHRGRALRPRGSTPCSSATCGTIRPSARTRDELVADLWDHQPSAHQPKLALEAPVLRAGRRPMRCPPDRRLRLPR